MTKPPGYPTGYGRSFTGAGFASALLLATFAIGRTCEWATSQSQRPNASIQTEASAEAEKLRLKQRAAAHSHERRERI
jgi:hypothetical protein